MSDLKAKFEDDAAAIALGHQFEGPDAEHNARLCSAAVGSSWCVFPVIVWRLTRAPVEGCIGFHLGDANGLPPHTVQLTLNSDKEYSGGRLCFVTSVTGNGNLQVLHRPTAYLTVTVHPRGVLHAVTQLHGGSRYSLFVVCKSANLGDVVVVDAAYAKLLLCLGSDKLPVSKLAHFLHSCYLIDDAGLLAMCTGANGTDRA